MDLNDIDTEPVEPSFVSQEPSPAKSVLWIPVLTGMLILVFMSAAWLILR